MWQITSFLKARITPYYYLLLFNLALIDILSRPRGNTLDVK